MSDTCDGRNAADNIDPYGRRMPLPNIPAAKLAGLPVDIGRLASDGDGWLSPEERYALKTWGICAQLQDHVFMVRIRVPGGVVPTAQARGAGRLAAHFGEDWLHLTTRQNLELHWVRDRDVPAVLDQLAGYGLSTRSACGHTVRNVMASEDAGVGLDEPFDCLPDARMISDALIGRSAALNVALPSRLNIALGGSPRCRHDALVNDVGLVSTVEAGVAGYEMWCGGSLGKAPKLGVLLAPFVPRDDVLAAVEAVVDVFVEHGAFDEPAKGRLKYVVERLGADGLRGVWAAAFAAARHRPHPPVVPVELVDAIDRAGILAESPPGGWRSGVRPQRRPGLASVTIDLPLGDITSFEMELFCDLADRHADGFLTLTRDQNLTLRNVPLAAVATIRTALEERGLHLLGEGRHAQIRACTGSAVCALGITDSPGAGRDLSIRGSLQRNPSLRLFVSGCPNACAQHQIADIGLSGAKVRVADRTVDGYQVYLGADLDRHELGEVVGRVGEEHLGLAVDAIVGTWEALRHHGEVLGRTARRVGLDAFANQVTAALQDRWAPGTDTADTAVELSLPGGD
jgi:sulfite reductase beta subunit-like hemoprotein